MKTINKNTYLELCYNKLEGLSLRLTKLFPCNKCGNCCKWGKIEVEGEDLIRLKSLTNPCDWLDYKDLKPPCVFLKSNKCDIYSIRPQVCKIFPLGIDPINTNKYHVTFIEIKETENCAISRKLYDEFERLKKRYIPDYSTPERIKLSDGKTWSLSIRYDIFEEFLTLLEAERKIIYGDES